MNADGFTKIPNMVLRTLMDGADCKTAILLALESRRGYSEKGLPLALLEHEVAIDEEPRPRRTFETALKALLEAELVIKAGTRYYSAAVFALMTAPKTRQDSRQQTGQDSRQDSRQEAAKTEQEKAVSVDILEDAKEGNEWNEENYLNRGLEGGSYTPPAGVPRASERAKFDFSKLQILSTLLSRDQLERIATRYGDVSTLERWERDYSPEFLRLAWKLAPGNALGKPAQFAFQGWLERENNWPWPVELRALWDKPTTATAESPPSSSGTPPGAALGAAYTTIKRVSDDEIPKWGEM